MQLIFPKDYIDYNTAMHWFEQIKNFNNRQSRLDEEKIFVLEHNNVYTAGKSISNYPNEIHVQQIHNTPVVYTNRGGLWTWHGVGQVVVYFIYNLHARRLFISDFMDTIESITVKNIVFELEKLIGRQLTQTNLAVYADGNKRGFWVKNINTSEISKIGFIGLRVSNGFVYHGISINYNNDLTFFDYINPCGLGDVKITSIKETAGIENINKQLDINNFKHHLGNSLFNALETLHGKNK